LYSYFVTFLCFNLAFLLLGGYGDAHGTCYCPGRAKGQAIICWRLIAQALVQILAITSGICGGEGARE